MQMQIQQAEEEELLVAPAQGAMVCGTKDLGRIVSKLPPACTKCLVATCGAAALLAGALSSLPRPHTGNPEAPAGASGPGPMAVTPSGLDRPALLDQLGAGGRQMLMPRPSSKAREEWVTASTPPATTSLPLRSLGSLDLKLQMKMPLPSSKAREWPSTGVPVSGASAATVRARAPLPSSEALEELGPHGAFSTRVAPVSGYSAARMPLPSSKAR